MTNLIRCYSELKMIPTIEERFKYLKMEGSVGESSYTVERGLAQEFYRNSGEWRKARNRVILRDDGTELGIKDKQFTIFGPIYIHHMNGITTDDLESRNPDLWNPEYLICVSESLHKALHYGDISALKKYTLTERYPNDTSPWRR